MLSEIKLIIWDLDETLWQGTLSDESDINLIKENIEFIKNSIDMGIVHSICSKNDFAKAKEKLEQLGVWNLFVFPSIDWNPKGQRIKKIISDMNLRDANTLFIDDNIQNLNEAKFYCGNIMIKLPNELSELYDVAKNSEKKDLMHKRMAQYKVLEQKVKEQESFESNEDFLLACNIRVEIASECEKHVERIHDLISRSNQLNYTKKRSTIGEVEEIIKDGTITTGYVSVKDKFGDYGIVGFYAIRENKAIHYVFSCRTLGMLVEQYVYMKLGCPKIDVVDEVVTKLNEVDIPRWINQDVEDMKDEKQKVSLKVLMKGPCDMEQIFSFIEGNENIDTEFTYTNEKGVLTEGHNHLLQIATSLKIDDDEKKKIITSSKIFDDKMLDTKLKKNVYDVVVLSLLPVCALGVYEDRKGNNIALCEKYYDLTDNKNQKLYIEKKIYTSGINFTKECLDDFSKKYKYVRDENYEKTMCGLNEIYDYIKPECKLVLILGSEQKYKKKCKVSYLNRELEHKKLNEIVKKWSKDKENVKLLSIDKYIQSSSDFLDTINHFSKKVYYYLANDLVKIFNSTSSTHDNKIKGKMSLLIGTILQKIKLLKNRIRNTFFENK